MHGGVDRIVRSRTAKNTGNLYDGVDCIVRSWITDYSCTCILYKCVSNRIINSWTTATRGILTYMMALME